MGKRCYAYIRVSTEMQVEGHSLEAQREEIKRYANYANMTIVDEYCDKGKSGKSIEGRPEFQRMFNDICSGKDKIDYVLVYKLSRFGRNAADVLCAVQKLEDYEVNLYCVQDSIDSAQGVGKLLISVLAAVSEIERDNILVQTMAGREQKAREGKWNGGFAPYGYQLVDGKLEIDEEEAEVVRIIFDKFVTTKMGANSIANYLNDLGIKKTRLQKHELSYFSASFIKKLIDNEVYCGKIAYCKRKTVKKPGTRNEYEKKKQDEYIVSQGIHEAIIDEETWQRAHEKRLDTGIRSEKVYNVEHEHILSGILKCPVCGASLYGSRSKKSNGKNYYSYSCKHRRYIEDKENKENKEKKCDFGRSFNQDKVNSAVVEVIKEMVNNKKFADAIKEKINSKIDTKSIDDEILQIRQNIDKRNRKIKKLKDMQNNLDIDDKDFEKKYNKFSDDINNEEEIINDLEETVKEKEVYRKNIEKQKISIDGIYKYLLYFDKLYDKFNDREKKMFFNSFVERIDLYEEEQANGQFLKHIKFKFPVFFNGREVTEIGLDNQNTVETVVLLSKKPQ